MPITENYGMEVLPVYFSQGEINHRLGAGMNLFVKMRALWESFCNKKPGEEG